MILFGHIGISIFAGTLISLSLFAVFLGSLLPDVIDKGLYFFGLADTGRFIGHTLFLGLLISFIVHIILRKKLVSVSLLSGYYLHLFEDAVKFVPWFYPFINYDFSAYAIGPIFTPFNITSEVIGIILLVYLYQRNSHFRHGLNKFLRLRKKYPINE